MNIKTKMLLRLCALPLLLWSCTDTLQISDKRIATQHEDFSLQEAKEFFYENTMQLAVTSRSMQDDGAIRLSAGEFTPDWDKAVASAKNDLMCYDVPIDCEHTYKAVMLSKENKTLTLDAVDVCQKLIIVKSRTTGEVGQYLLTLVPDIAYERQHQGEVADLFINAGNKGRFSGVVIYSVPGLDLIVRANRYTNGTKTKGVHLSGDKKEMKEKIFWLKSILRPFQLYRNPNIQSRTVAGEAYILEWFKRANCKVEQVGSRFILYEGQQVRHILIDEDGDGTPDKHTSDCCGSNIDPDTESDTDTNPKVCHYCKKEDCNGSCIYLSDAILDDKKIEYDIDKYPGYSEEEDRDCKDVADMLMEQGLDGYIGSSDNVIQLYKETVIAGDTVLVGGYNSDYGFNVLNDHLDENRPIMVGTHYRYGYKGNNDETTDHFVVIYGRGYDENKEQYYFNYIETGRSKGKAQEAYSNNLRFYYNPNEGTFKGYNIHGKKIYDLVQIRPNNNKKNE